ncbi:hypothetical protein V499_02243 [Pseudogymnoascus sp. VKM F-103]|nr:hypothetical protein V499_02243 [Pseudogymnoascus sp. VKM F-103]
MHYLRGGIAAYIGPAVALPSLSGSNLTAIGLDSQGETLLGRRGLDGEVQLRILPLGASITYGQTSTDGNGYRFGLRNQLVYNGNAVNMIGSVQSGSMVDNDVEGWPGFVIDQVAEKAELSIPSQPNLVLINVGTNDCIKSVDIANAHVRLGKMIDRLLSAIPGVTVICSTLLPNGNAVAEANVKSFNSQLPAMVSNYQTAGKKVLLVDFHSSFFSLSDIGTDGTHPTNAGYQKLAAVWYQGIQVAADANWLTAPAPVTGLSDIVVGGNTCQKTTSSSIGPVKTQQGSGFDDGRYVHTGVNVGTMTGFAGNTDAAGVYWADINGDGIDDYVYVAANANQGFGVSLSSGGGVSGAYAHFNLDIYCLRRGVRFADMTGDGRDDFCCLAPNGDLACWQNTPGSDPRNPTWVSMGIVFTNKGYVQAQVRLADIDGDGRADYVALSYDGTSILGWRNGATGHVKPQYWNPMSGVISGLPKLTPLSGWQFVDLNGDHKDDLVHVSTNGQVTTWINQRGQDVGLTPVWVSMGQTHGGAASPQNITFGTFWGSGRGDYAEVYESGGTVKINRFQNKDVGGTMVKGDGVRYCDMRGTGADDYIWISSTGEIWLYGNKHAPPNWIQYGIIGNVNRPRKEVHFADFDGDGRCDILLVDKATGSTTMLRNDWDGTKFTFTNIGVVSGGATPCTQGYGYTNNDLGVRFADIDGDGKADYLCLELDGRMTGALNRGLNKLVNQGQIKFSEAKEREHIWIADINGDGRADYLFVDGLTGAVTAWTNEGNSAQSGSTFTWTKRGIVAVGYTARGSCINFGNLYGVGRADYIIVNPQGNTAHTYFNVCPDGGLTPQTPTLPVVTVPGPAPPSGGGHLVSFPDRWKTVSCKDIDINSYAPWVWFDYECNYAWEQGIAYWKSPGNQVNQFSEELAAFFNATTLRTTMDCLHLNDENGCGSADEPCIDGVAAAADIILSSMINLDAEYWQLYLAVLSATQDTWDDASNIASTFDPPPGIDQTAEFIFSLLQQVWTIGISPGLGKIITRGFGEDAFFDKVKDAADMGFDAIKETLSGDNPIDPTAELQDQLKAMSDLWLIGLEAISNSTFNGSDAGIDLLRGIISGGEYFIKRGVGAYEMRRNAELPMYAKLIPLAWSYDNGDYLRNPNGVVVVDSAIACNTDDDCQGDYSFQGDEYVTKDAISKTCHCYQGNLYFLVQAYGAPEDCVAAPVLHCDPLPFTTPKGLDDLDGTKWGGLTLATFIEGSVNTYKANNNANGFVVDFSDPFIINAFADGGVLAPGGIQIPVCNAVEAYGHWDSLEHGGVKGPNFPCNNN